MIWHETMMCFFVNFLGIQKKKQHQKIHQHIGLELKAKIVQNYLFMEVCTLWNQLFKFLTFFGVTVFEQQMSVLCYQSGDDYEEKNRDYYIGCEDRICCYDEDERDNINKV